MRTIAAIAFSLAFFLVGAALAVNFRGFTARFAREAVRQSPNSLFNPSAPPPGPLEVAGRVQDATALARIVGVIFAGAGLFMLNGAFALLDG
ncbi:hypothetical protein KZZ52_20795 [Dactylosporangium sp. AC04546]|uniref:hypothetical protein n=1 Tax=Dactylosporangium sp. AC04546 TaxID=2862460 RepID=UPI001EDD553E|nr:hypothetical protein [Dactylosporangium sp. AC04546]WVK87728.1 hypothetical protein KZZ52_20795 [Dactylosporangium sp. AC04546]